MRVEPWADEKDDRSSARETASTWMETSRTLSTTEQPHGHITPPIFLHHRLSTSTVADLHSAVSDVRLQDRRSAVVEVDQQHHTHSGPRRPPHT